MKKVFSICFIALFVAAGANARTKAGTRTPQNKIIKQKAMKSLQSKEAKAKLKTAKLQMRKEGE